MSTLRKSSNRAAAKQAKANIKGVLADFGSYDDDGAPLDATRVTEVAKADAARVADVDKVVADTLKVMGDALEGVKMAMEMVMATFATLAGTLATSASSATAASSSSSTADSSISASSTAASSTSTSSATVASSSSSTADTADSSTTTPPPAKKRKTGTDTATSADDEDYDVDVGSDEDAESSHGDCATTSPLKKRKRASGKPDCSNTGCTRVAHREGLCQTCKYGNTICSVPGCTATAFSGLKQCKTHRYPCSVDGCSKSGIVITTLGFRFCRAHARSEAPVEHRQDREGRKIKNQCSIDGCNLFAVILGSYCLSHGRENAPEAYMQYREGRNVYRHELYRDNANYKIATKARSRLNKVLRKCGTSHHGKLKLIGCTIDQLRRYLDSFRCMAVDQHIDHIMPLASFDLTDTEQLGRATHWSNLQPLSAADNLSKGHDEPVDFEWNVVVGRWMWGDDNGQVNLELPGGDLSGDLKSPPENMVVDLCGPDSDTSDYNDNDDNE